MCPLGFSMLGSTLQDLPSDSPAACRSTCRRRQASLRTGSPQRMILACTRPVLVGHAVELATAQPPPTTTARSKPTPRLAQHRLRQLRAPGSNLGQTTSRSWTQRATTPTPAIPAVRLPAHRRAPGPHFGRTQRTRQRTDTGRPHRTPDSGRRTADAGQRTPDSGHRTADTWTLRRPHRTLDTGRWPRTRAGDDGAAGIRTSRATTPSDRALGRPTVFLWTGACGARQPMQARR
jgi:hypothetical protein